MQRHAAAAATFEDWEGVHDAVADAYFPHDLRPMARDGASRSGVEVVDLAHCRLAHIQFGADVEVHSEHPGGTAINIQLTGAMESRVGGSTVRAAAGQAAVLPPDTPAHLPNWTRDCSILGLRIDSDYLVRETERTLGRPDITLPPVVDVSTPAGRSWLALARNTFDTARSSVSPLYRDRRMADAVANMLVTGMLLAVGPDEESRYSVRPRTVQRVIRSIEADPSHPWSPSEMAEVAGVCVRRLQQAFREHVRTSPLGYLKRVRLERCRDDLLAGSGTVSEIAMRWGITHLGRFASEYHDRYGELPSQTLDRRG